MSAGSILGENGSMTSTTTEWGTATLPEAGFAPDLEERFDVARQAGVLPNLHGVVAARNGRISFERYLAGVDAARGRPLGVVRFGPDTLHDMRSVTKSIVGLLYGIALANGCAPMPEATLVEQFLEYPELATDPARLRLTVGHALTMTLSTEWEETTIPYTDPRNSRKQ
jgi:CubicO group peptidase (beta-lactamase class C family)